jgi:hypothetical protein
VAASSVVVPIIVAIIGIVGTIAPIYINNKGPTTPQLEIVSTPLTYLDAASINPSGNYGIFIRNFGNAPATNLSLFLNACGFFGIRSCPSEIHNITSGYSTVNMIVPQFNNASLERGVPLTVNGSLVKIQIARLVQGAGSVINLMSSVNDSRYPLTVYAVYDQGSTTGSTFKRTFIDSLYPLIDWYSVYVGPLFLFYIIFYAIFFALLYRYIRRRKASKKFITGLTDNIMEVRRTLRDDHTNRVKLPDAWSESNMSVSRRHRAIKEVTDYLLLDDFYSTLGRRNNYLKDLDKERSDLARANTLSKHNEAVLAAAENALNKVDWNKYR